MAQRVQIILEDDYDGGVAEETVSFGLDGAEYEIDLSAKNAANLRDALAPWLGHARKTGGRRKRGSSKSVGLIEHQRHSGLGAGQRPRRQQPWPSLGRRPRGVREGSRLIPASAIRSAPIAPWAN